MSTHCFDILFLCQLTDGQLIISASANLGLLLEARALRRVWKFGGRSSVLHAARPWRLRSSCPGVSQTCQGSQGATVRPFRNNVRYAYCTYMYVMGKI